MWLGWLADRGQTGSIAGLYPTVGASLDRFAIKLTFYAWVLYEQITELVGSSPIGTPSGGRVW